MFNCFFQPIHAGFDQHFDQRELNQQQTPTGKSVKNLFFQLEIQLELLEKSKMLYAKTSLLHSSESNSSNGEHAVPLRQQRAVSENLLQRK